MNSNTFNELPKALILAGGQGERLFPLTKSRPKAAVPFGGAFRIIDFTLSNCMNSGLTDVALLTQHLYQDIHSYIRQNWGELWENSEPGRKPLLCLPPVSGKRYRGTADAVFQNIHVISANESQHLLILSGDHVYRMDYSTFFRKHVATDADLTIASVEHSVEDARQLGVVEVDKNLRVTRFLEKPAQPQSLPQRPGKVLVSMGVYAFKVKTLLDALQVNCGNGFGYDFGRHVIPSLIGSANVYAHNFRDEASGIPLYWRDIGTIDSYYAASMDMVRPDGPLGTLFSARNVHAQLSAEARLSRTVISPGVRVEGNAEIESSVLLPGARVATGARLRHVIVAEGVHLPAGFTAGWDSESDRRNFAVTPGGVVVISETPRKTKPPTIHFRDKNMGVGYTPRDIIERCA